MSIRTSQAFRLLFGVLVSTALASCATARRPGASAPGPTLAPTVPPVTRPAPVRVDVEVARQADGRSVVSDVGYGYEFVLDQEWMVVPVSGEHVDRLAHSSPAPDSEFLGLAQALLEKKMDAFRLVGINTDNRFAKPAQPTLLLVTAIPDRVSAALPVAELAHMIENTVFTDATGVRTDVVHNANGMNIAVVEGPYEYLSTQGDTLSTRSKVLGFQANSRVILIQFITPVEFGADVLPGTDRVIDTIERIKP